MSEPVCEECGGWGIVELEPGEWCGDPECCQPGVPCPNGCEEK